MNNLQQATEEVIRAFNVWLDADGIFPEPEYEDFLAAMDRLADEAGCPIFVPKDSP